jgi:hypothetical protein
MIAKGRSTALTYTKEPYLICVSIEPKEELYYVPDSALPALSLGKQCDPMSLITSQELYALKKKYRTPHSLIKRMQECYKKIMTNLTWGTLYHWKIVCSFKTWKIRFWAR